MSKNFVINLKQKKSLSQIFLNSKIPVLHVIKILHNFKVKEVLEIGAGRGILTIELLKNNFKVKAIEKDIRFCKFLKDKIDNEYHMFKSNIDIINEDILNFNFDSYINTYQTKNFNIAIVGNIPYSISTPILSRVLPYLSKISCCVLMLQKEFAKRIVAKPSSKDYGSLSIFVQARAQVVIDCIISSRLFKPQPKVDSALVTFINKPDKEDDFILEKLERLTKLSFSQRRKTLKNALKKILPYSSNFESIPIDLSKRAENLSYKEYILLVKYLIAQKLL